MYKHFHRKLPGAFDYFFAKQNTIYQTRKKDNYILTKTRTKFALKSIRNKGPSVWNSLNISEKHAKSVNTLKNHLKNERILNYD